MSVDHAKNYAKNYGYDIKVCGPDIPVQLNESSQKIDVWVDDKGLIYKVM